MGALTDAESRAMKALSGHVGTIVARSIWQGAIAKSGVDPAAVSDDRTPALVHALESGMRAFVSDGEVAKECSARLREAFDVTGNGSASASEPETLVVDILAEYDVVIARGQAREMCESLGFPASEQIKVATVVSELARNIIQYVGRGRVELELLKGEKRGLEIRAIDQGAGIPHLEGVLAGEYQSDTGMGMGLRGAQRLMDDFTVESKPGLGTRVTARRYTR